MIIKSILDVDDRIIASFSSGNDDIDRFFHNFAKINDRIGYGKTFVGFDNDKIVGFFTLSCTDVEYGQTSLSPSLPKYPIPGVRIGRLAVSKELQRKGYGKELLKNAFLKIITASINVGIYLVIVDAKEEAASFYKERGFAPLNKSKTTYYLPINIVVKAIINR